MSIIDKSYIYIRAIKDRSNTYITGELHRGIYVKIYELNINKQQLLFIDKVLKSEFKHLNIHYNGGLEFYDRTIIDKIEPFFIENKIKFISKNEDELARINRDNNETIIINNYLKLVKNILLLAKEKEEKKKEEVILRDYQIDAINHIEKELIKTNKIYLCLATGAGKTQIAFNVFDKIKPQNLLIFSPRVAIKNQNNKYPNNPNIHNYCYQSYKNVYDLITKNNIKNLFIWFDEAHWTLDNWTLLNIDYLQQLAQIKNLF